MFGFIETKESYAHKPTYPIDDHICQPCIARVDS